LSAPLPTVHSAPVLDGWTTYPSLNDVQAVAFAPDGALWTASTAGVVRWNLADGTYRLHTTADGLGSNLATDVAIASDGSLWAATLGGVSHLEGNRWTNYTHADGLVSNTVQAIAVTSQGQVWAGTTEGAGCLQGGVWTTFLAGARVWDLDVAPDGSLWFAADGLGVSRYSQRDKTWTTYTTADGLPSLSLTAIAAGPAGDAWVYVPWEGVYRFDGAKWQLAQAQAGLVCALAAQADGTPWIGACGSLHYTWGRLVHRQEDGWVEVTGWHDMGAPPIQAIAFGPGGQIAVGTDRGLSIAGPGGWQTLLPGPIRSQVTAVAVTPDGVAWFGFGNSASDAAGGGLSRFDGREWQHFLGDANVQTLAVGPDGTLWAGDGCALWQFRAGNWRQVGTCEQIKGNVLDIALASDGTVWVATGLALARFDGESWATVDRLVHLASIAPGDTLWAVGWEGTQGSDYVARLDGSGWTKSLDRSLASLVVAPDGHVWGVDGERGLARSDGESWEFLQPPADLGPIRALAIGPDGTLWAGGNDQIAHLGESGWFVYPSVEGVQAIAFAADGSLWLATSNGVAHSQPPH
jgi:ligand-binding sensor domain-containing protein